MQIDSFRTVQTRGNRMLAECSDLALQEIRGGFEGMLSFKVKPGADEPGSGINIGLMSSLRFKIHIN